MVMYFDYGGKPIEAEEWSRLFLSDERRVATDVLEEKNLRVSTVWVGLSWGDETPALIYETMAFLGDSYEEAGCWRWETREEAMEGHRRVVDDILGVSPSGD